MTGPVAASTGSAANAATTRRPWDQQPGENDRWYSRFLRFIALGPGRSVSLVSTGKRNAYPVPAHWPIQSKQLQWRERAKAFDEAVRSTPSLIEEFRVVLAEFAPKAPVDEQIKFMGLTYVLVPEDDELGLTGTDS